MEKSDTSQSPSIGGVVRDVSGYRFIVEYKVIQLSKVDGESMLEAHQPGMMLFCPLMQHDRGTTTLDWIRHCVETTMSLSVDTPTRDNLLIGLMPRQVINDMYIGQGNPVPTNGSTII